jgi:hypothetical protein
MGQSVQLLTINTTEYTKVQKDGNFLLKSKDWLTEDDDDDAAAAETILPREITG